MQGPSFKLNIADVPVAVLAGGLATRLGDISRQTPKALVDIDGHPFIDHQLALLHRHGIRRVVMCLGHLGQQIEEHLGDGATRGMEIQYSYDGPTLAGTGGAVRRALPMLGDVFWVMYGDSYMDIDYAAILDRFVAWAARPCRQQNTDGLPVPQGDKPESDPRRVRLGGRGDGDVAHCAGSNHAPRGDDVSAKADPTLPMGLMTVIRNDNRWDRSNAIFENGRLTCYDKRNRLPEMRYIDFGVQLVRREALETSSAAQTGDLSDLYHDMVGQGRMVGYEVFNRFYEIGTPQSLEETRLFLSTSSPLVVSPRRGRAASARRPEFVPWARPDRHGPALK